MLVVAVWWVGWVGGWVPSGCLSDVLREEGKQLKAAVFNPSISLLPPQATFGYLQVVNPEVYAELMQAKLDPSSPGTARAMGGWVC